MHRRETWDEGIARVCRAIRSIVQERRDVRIAFPVHPGPAVHNRVYAELEHVERVHLLPPLDYRTLIALACHSHILMTDSGGLQEEGAALHKPVLVLRDVTERREALAAGTARLVGTDPDKIIRSVIGLIDSSALYREMSEAPNPFGDGHAAQRITASLQAWFEKGNARLPEGAEFTVVESLPVKSGRKRLTA